MKGYGNSPQQDGKKRKPTNRTKVNSPSKPTSNIKPVANNLEKTINTPVNNTENSNSPEDFDTPDEQQMTRNPPTSRYERSPTDENWSQEEIGLPKGMRESLQCSPDSEKRLEQRIQALRPSNETPSGVRPGEIRHQGGLLLRQGTRGSANRSEVDSLNGRLRRLNEENDELLDKLSEEKRLRDIVNQEYLKEKQQFVERIHQLETGISYTLTL